MTQRQTEFVVPIFIVRESGGREKTLPTIRVLLYFCTKMAKIEKDHECLNMTNYWKHISIQIHSIKKVSKTVPLYARFCRNKCCLWLQITSPVGLMQYFSFLHTRNNTRSAFEILHIGKYWNLIIK